MGLNKIWKEVREEWKNEKEKSPRTPAYKN